jgi:preprotein translocase subunit SecD
VRIKTAILFAVLGAVVIGNLFATDYVEYELNKDKIQKTRVVDAPEGRYAVGIELNTYEKELFRRITANNVGKRLAITYKGNVLIKPIVRDEISSGLMVIGDYETREEAEEFIGVILSE